MIGVARVHIIGNSMGGHSKVAFALANPGRVGKLVLMGGGTGGPTQFVPMPAEGKFFEIFNAHALVESPKADNVRL